MMIQKYYNKMKESHGEEVVSNFVIGLEKVTNK
jgi:hypothetical protein